MPKFEHIIGETKGTVVENEVQANFQGECAEVGMYLAMARQAFREGMPEVGMVLKQIAYEEADHASRFAELNEVIKPTLKDNLEMMLEGELMANKEKKEASIKADEADIDTAADFFDESSKDEGRHAKALQGILARYF